MSGILVDRLAFFLNHDSPGGYVVEGLPGAGVQHREEDWEENRRGEIFEGGPRYGPAVICFL